jgi:hypothetical protein
LADVRKEGRLRVLGPVTLNGETPGTMSTEDVVNAVEDACLHTQGNQRVRIAVDLTPLLISLGLDDLLSFLSRLMGASQCNGGVIIGIIQSGLIGDQAIEKLRSLADGIIRIWKHGDFDYLQVLKTINSVRTRVQAILETPEPPYIQILS